MPLELVADFVGGVARGRELLCVLATIYPE
jgi:hypothetical protein